jgi:antitoxin HigA-1
MDQYRFTEGLGYNPNKLLNELIVRLRLRNDAALCRTLQVAPPLISKVRHKRAPLSASVLIRMHEESGLSIRDLRRLMGDRRQKYRVGDAASKPCSG